MGHGGPAKLKIIIVIIIISHLIYNNDHNNYHKNDHDNCDHHQPPGRGGCQGWPELSTGEVSLMSARVHDYHNGDHRNRDHCNHDHHNHDRHNHHRHNPDDHNHGDHIVMIISLIIFEKTLGLVEM